jgi:hypothetical protein
LRRVNRKKKEIFSFGEVFTWGVKLSSTNYIERLVVFLREEETSWNKSILPNITRFLNITNPTKDDIDSLLMEVTKRVETELRSALANKLRKPVPPDRSFGISLLEYSVDSHLITNKDEPIYSLLELILRVPRNTSHHTFTMYPYKTIVMFLSEANEALERINRLTRPTYLSDLATAYNTSTKRVEIQAKIFRPDLTLLPTDRKVDAILTFPQDRVKTIPLTAGALDTWIGAYDVRGEPCGTVTCFVRGFDGTSSFEATSGSGIFVSCDVGQKCPNCGSTVNSPFMAVCSRCGSTLPIV